LKGRELKSRCCQRRSGICAARSLWPENVFAIAMGGFLCWKHQEGERTSMTKAQHPFEDSYLGQLRKFVGSRLLISPGARAILRDEQRRVLLIRRHDNGTWGMPAGSLELQESILDCLKREVWEETGLEVLQATPIALYPEPRFAFLTVFGDPIQ